MRAGGASVLAVTTNWGIAGTGSIASSFADALAQVPDARLAAVGSRSADRSAEFAARFGCGTSYASYEALAADPNVDVVYIATPHSRHLVDALLFIEAGKHVLCEKPMALSAEQGRRMAAAARERGVFLMEAMWSRFLPAYRTMVELIGEGRIGDPMMVEADFGFRKEFDPHHRLFDLQLGGGSTMDVGIYPAHLCSLVLGPPDQVQAVGDIGPTGSDDTMAAVLHHPGGALGVIKSSVRLETPCIGTVSGTKGSIHLPNRMHCAEYLVLRTPDGEERFDRPLAGNGLRFQVHEVHACLARGATESSIMPLEETLSILSTLDRIRAALGVVYPGE